MVFASLLPIFDMLSGGKKATPTFALRKRTVGQKKTSITNRFRKNNRLDPLCSFLNGTAIALFVFYRSEIEIFAVV
jgi:hypothetical protein